MNIKDKELLDKFQQAIEAKLSYEEAIDFFAKLNADEYDRLLEIFTNNDFSEIDNETKNKLIVILQQLKEVVNVK